MQIAVLGALNNISNIGWFIAVGGFFLMIISAIIYWQDLTRRSSGAFLVLSVVNFLWGLCYIFFAGTIGGPHALLGTKVLYIGAAAMPIFLYIFFYTFSVVGKPLSFFALVSLFVPYAVMVGILYVAPGLIVLSKQGADGASNTIVFGPAFWVYAVYIIAYLGAGLVVLYKKYLDSAGIFRIAICRLLITVSVTYFVAVATSLLSPLFVGSSDLFWGGHIAAIVMLYVAVVIIVLYNFWNIKVIATEFFISIIILTMIAEVVFATSVVDLIIKTFITFLIIFSCTFLDRSVRREIEYRDKIQRLSQDIDIIAKRLKILDKKKSEFLAIASHHLRAPLTAIKGYSSMILDGSYGEISSPVKNSVGKILDSSERLITVVEDFLDISRIESGDMNYRFSGVDMKRLILELVDEMQSMALRASLVLGVVIDEDKSPDTSFVVTGDEGKLRQVISNLIDNAIKYTPKGEISILLSKSPDGKKILFSIADTGIGMSEETKGKIFKKFSRAEGVSKLYTEGTGLGLYVASEVVKKHGGRIWVESKGEGHGSTFYVELEAKK